MKIKTLHRTYDEVMALPRPKHKKPWKPTVLLGTVMRIASAPDLWATRFSYTRDKKSEPKEPSLILMNHSSFVDLKIASGILYPKPYGIVCTTDAMVGKGLLMKLLGCIPTQKFVTDLNLIRDMKYMLKEKKTSVLMYPEAGYSFDGRATTMPAGLGGLLKMLDVPVLMITTHGAFARDPLYNGLQNRKVKVTADVKTLLTREQVGELPTEELDKVIGDAFTFDNFAWQYENGIKITEKFRADGLHRILYKCPACKAEGQMEGKGTHLTCHACKKSWFLTELGRLEATEGETEFPHIPDWYDWERAEVKAEIEAGAYSLDTSVKIALMIDYKGLYMVGDGRLTHTSDGLTLDGCEGKLHYEQKPRASHTLNADFYWYCIGDVIGIGNRDCLYYCFPQAVDGKIPPVAKARLATEELYKIAMATRRQPPRSKNE
ncbi:MAG: 1-acyl-sn-glycerol-3-phosphate acyltransferase [Clostridia bacterium]|nr:1-acyl-sn-glycerol-3-phosphate acyltransferase [Clostridia bacterium]